MNFMGRHTNYTPELLEKAHHYRSVWKELGQTIPSVVGLCDYLQISKSIAYLWITQEDKKEFLDILEEIATKQEMVLINGGLEGKLNSTITKLMLTKHGYSDKQELMGKDGEKLEVGVVILPNKNGTDEDTLAAPTKTEVSA